MGPGLCLLSTPSSHVYPYIFLTPFFTGSRSGSQLARAGLSCPPRRMGGRKPRIDMVFRVTERELMAIRKAASSGLTTRAKNG